LWQEFGFGLLALRQSRESLLELAGQLCRAVAERPFKVLGRDQNLSASIGLALPTGDLNKPADSWIAAAFAAQAVAHRLGGNRFDGVLDIHASSVSAERLLLIREVVKQAGRGENILVEFQPMLRLNSAHMDQYAVVVKLRDARAPLSGISRAEFLDSARSAAAMAAIERVALSRAFEIIEEQHSHGRETQISVALDLASLDRSHFLWLEAELRRRGPLASRLVIEVDGGWLLERPNLHPIVQRLRSLDVGLTLNESAGLLTRMAAYQALPATQLRVPYSAVHTLDANALALIFNTWRQSGRALIVDHIDDVAAVMRLWSFGIDYLQGDTLAAPSPRLELGAIEVEA
jgi:multidomain signaling protein FimX